MEANFKKDFYRFILTLLITFTVLGTVLGIAVVVIDPFYQYHAPWLNMPVILEDAVYQTPGAARNLKYRDAIIGTSMTENFHTKWFDEELGWDTIKLSYSGARSNDINAILQAIFSKKEPVDHIFMDINDYQLTSPSWTAYAERPAYLYDTNLLNDYKYIYSRDVIARAWERVLDTLQGAEDNIDTAYTWEDDTLFGAEKALAAVSSNRNAAENPEDNQTISPESQEQKLVTCQENLDNILPYIEQNPDTEFIIYFPPYSMLYWEEKKLGNNLESIIEIYHYAAKCFLEFDNVTVYYFQNEYDIITNINNYRDACHHHPKYNRYIFECIKNGEKKITKDNLDSVFSEMYHYANDYDYSIYWQ